MNTLQSEITELKQFIADIKAERAAQKEKEKREWWTKYVSLTLVCLAVLTAIATLKGGGFTTRTLKEMNEATFNQAQASDQWAFFQAKSIKQNLYEIELDHLKNAAGVSSNLVVKVQGKVDKYEKEKAEIMKEARHFEEQREAARKLASSAAEHSRDMGLAITFFQVSIALGGICLVVKKQPLWFVSLALGSFAAVKMFIVLQTPIAAAPSAAPEAKAPPAITTNAPAGAPKQP